MNVPNGSRWWLYGHSYEVVGQTERDGEPAVRIKNRDRHPTKHERDVNVRILVRDGIPQD